MRYRISILAIFAAIIVTACGQRQPSPQPPVHDPQEAATRALGTLQKMITPQNYKAMGFQSVDEANSATLGQPLAVFHVRLDQLREYKADQDPNKLLVDAGQNMYPVAVKDQVRSSIVIAKTEDTWKAVRFGGPNLIQALAKVRGDEARASQMPETSYFIVQVPALNTYFLGHRADGKLMLTPLLDDSASNFKAGVTMTGEAALGALVAGAKKYNELPE